MNSRTVKIMNMMKKSEVQAANNEIPVASAENKQQTDNENKSDGNLVEVLGDYVEPAQNNITDLQLLTVNEILHEEDAIDTVRGIFVVHDIQCASLELEHNSSDYVIHHSDTLLNDNSVSTVILETNNCGNDQIQESQSENICNDNFFVNAEGEVEIIQPSRDILLYECEAQVEILNESKEANINKQYNEEKTLISDEAGTRSEDNDSNFSPDSSSNGDSESDVSNRSANEDEEPANLLDEIQDGDTIKKNTRKRRRKEATWKCNIRKKARTSGKEYVSTRKTIIRARHLKVPCKNTCKLKCFEKFSEEDRQNILNEFWNENVDYDRKRQFVASNIDILPVQRQRSRNGTRDGKRQVTYVYTLSLKNRVKQRVCKKFFLSTLDISQNFVDVAIRKKLIGGVIMSDGRSGQEPPNKISQDVREGISNHIQQFPTYDSHYSREKSSRKYLECDLNISKMHQLYVEDCEAKHISSEKIGKLWLYREIFNTEFNLSFKQPSNDTCDMCDAFIIKLKDSSNNEDKQTIQAEYDRHLEEAKRRYEEKRKEKQEAKETLNKKVVMIDLEKCLATPLLKNSQSFYSLKLWTFNLTIHDSTLKKTYCMMWDETVSGRGGNEIGSCILKWAQTELNPQIQELTIWSDNCPSQNRNLMIVMTYFYIMSVNPNLKIINYKYLLRGHTHLEADSDHALIERAQKRLPTFQIRTPWDWQQLVRIASNKFTVIDMNVEDFLNMKSLYSEKQSPFIKGRKAESGNQLRISEAVHLQVRSEKPGCLFFRTEFGTPFEEVNLNRRAKLPVSLISASPIRRKSKPISTKKYAHLQNLLQWVPKRFHTFYKELPHDNIATDEDEF